MNELIPVSYDSERPTVLGRDLHRALEIKTPYHKWFPRMCEYGFSDGVDYMTLEGQKCPTNNPKNPVTVATDHQLTLEMAKEVCMIQRSEVGKKCREYFIRLEAAWNTPEAVIARALQMANRQLEKIKEENRLLGDELIAASRRIEEMEPRVNYLDLILSSKNTMSVTQLAKDYGMSPQEFNKVLNKLGIQYKVNKQWVLYNEHAGCGYTASHVFNRGGYFGVQTRWTQKGRLFLYEALKAAGYIPLIERGEVA